MPVSRRWGWLLGDGEARGIALVFLVSGLIMVVVALLAFTSRSYRTLSEEYQRAPETDEDDGAPVDDGDDEPGVESEVGDDAHADAEQSGRHR